MPGTELSRGIVRHHESGVTGPVPVTGPAMVTGPAPVTGLALVAWAAGDRRFPPARPAA